MESKILNEHVLFCIYLNLQENSLEADRILLRYKILSEIVKTGIKPLANVLLLFEFITINNRKTMYSLHLYSFSWNYHSLSLSE